jgi:hypothetical protein
MPASDAAAADRQPAESYRLTAAATALTASTVVGSEPSPANVPANLLTLIRSIPAWEIQALDRFADAMNATGSWQVWGPTNVLGFDEQDPPKLKAVIDMMMPIQPFSSVLGEQFSWWAGANFPMNAGCAAKPGACPALNSLLDSTFKVPTSRLYEGYQFPTVTNPFTGAPTSWSGRYVKLDPGAAFAALESYLTGPRRAVATVTLGEATAVVAKAAKAVAYAYNPFVPNSEWFNPQQTGLADAFRVLAPNFCRTCDPEKPYDNPWLYDNYPAKSGPAPFAAVAAEGIPDTATATGTAGPLMTEMAAVVNEALFAEMAEESTVDKVPTLSDRSADTSEPNRSTAARRGLRASAD